MLLNQVQKREGAGEPQDDGQTGPEIAQEYAASLEDLTFNSKPLINTLTIIAGENIHVAKYIVPVIEKKIREVEADKKLPTLYLMDSICKNIGGIYIELFSKNLPEIFSLSYLQANTPIRNSMLHLLKTWGSIFPPTVLQQINTKIQNVKTPLVKTPSIHVNPKFLPKTAQPPPAKKPRTTIPPVQQEKESSRIDEILSKQIETTKTFQKKPSQRRPQTQNVPRRQTPALTQPRFQTGTGQGLLLDSALASLASMQPAPDLPQLQQQVQQTSQLLGEVQQYLEHQKVTSQVYEQLLQLQQQAQALQAQQMAKILALQASPQGTVPQPMLPDQNITQTSGLEIPNLINLLQQQQSLVNTSLPYSSSVLGSNVPYLSNQAGVQMHPVYLQSADIQSLGHNFGYSFAKPVTQQISPTPQPTFGGPSALPVADLIHDLFAPERLKIRNDAIINGFYFAFPLQCKNCGLRFANRAKMDQHLDWHFLQNRQEKERTRKAMSRNWYMPKEDWKSDNTLSEKVAPFPFGTTEPAKSEIPEEVPRVPADENQTNCSICGERFDQFWDNQLDEWMFRDAILVNNQIVHKKCHHLDPSPQKTEPSFQIYPDDGPKTPEGPPESLVLSSNPPDVISDSLPTTEEQLSKE